MISEAMLPQTVTVITGATVTDSYGNTRLEFDPDAVEDPDEIVTEDVQAWLEQDTRDEQTDGQGNRLIDTWTLITNDEVASDQQVAWDGKTFAVDGEPEKVYTPAGPHHYEMTLRRVEG